MNNHRNPRTAVWCCVALLATACNQGIAAGPPGTAELRGFLDRVGYGVVVAVHPYSCSLTVEDSRALSELHARKFNAEFAFIADPADSVSVSQVAMDLQLEIPWSTISPEAYGALIGSSELTTPTIVVVRGSRPLIIVNRMNLRRALRLLEPLYLASAGTG